MDPKSLRAGDAAENKECEHKHSAYFISPFFFKITEFTHEPYLIENFLVLRLS